MNLASLDVNSNDLGAMFATLAFVLPFIVWMLLKHQYRMAQLFQKRDQENASGDRIATLEQQVMELRSQLHSQTLMLEQVRDSAKLQQIQR